MTSLPPLVLVRTRLTMQYTATPLTLMSERQLGVKWREKSIINKNYIPAFSLLAQIHNVVNILKSFQWLNTRVIRICCVVYLDIV